MAIDGTSGDDSLPGTSGDDTINGLAGADILNGLAGADILNGDEDGDTLSGGADNDTLTGGAGADRFVFAPGDGEDVITDFDATGLEPDVLELSSYDSTFSTPADVLAAAAQDGADVLFTFNGSDTLRLQNVLLSDLDISHIRLLRDFDALTTAYGQTLSLSGVDADGYLPTFDALDVTLEADSIIEIGSVVDFEHPVVFISPDSTFVNYGLIDGRVIGTAWQGDNILGVGFNDSQNSESYIVFHNDGDVRVSGGANVWGIDGGVRAGQLYNSGLVEVVQEELGYSSLSSAIGLGGGHLDFVENSGIVIVSGSNESYGVLAGQAEMINSGEIYVSNQTSSAYSWAIGMYTAYTPSPSRPTAGHIENTGVVEILSPNTRAIGVYFYNQGVLDNQNEISATGYEAVGVYMRGGRDASITNSGDIAAVATGADVQSIGLLLESSSDEVTVIINSGNITADIAIDAPARGTPTSNGAQLITNSGEINGIVRLGMSDDQIDNSNGVINGDVDLGEGDDYLDTTLGVVNGLMSGGDGADTILGSVAAENIVGGTGNDSLSGGEGDDTINGGAGGDTMDGGVGFDFVSYEGSSSSVDVDLVTGYPAGGDSVGDVLFGIEGLIGSSSADVLSGDSGGNLFEGRDGSDWLIGRGGDDSLYGGADDDIVSGGEGADTMYGDAGLDTMSGGSGDDIIFGGDGDDTAGGDGGRDLMYGNDGADTLHGFGSHDSLYGGAGDDDLRGGHGKDLLGGSAGNDVLRGYDGDDRLFGGGNNDTLIGNEGNDSLIGGGGNDRLKGDDGDDTLYGSYGDDVVTGGTGDDVFQFRKTHAADTITDFTAGAGSEDAIQLLAFGASFDTFAEVIAAASQVGADTVIDFGGGDMLTLKNVTPGTLHQDDFIFG